MRPQIFEISISGILGIPVITDNVFYWNHPVGPTEDYYLVMNPAFWEWSAGAFLLKSIVNEYYHTFTGDPTHYPVDFSLTLVKPTSSHGYVINNVPFGVSTPPTYFTLPPPDQPYWEYGDDP
jgi:hypothetical protein